MGNIPIHPMIVHFPIVFAILLPFTAVASLYLIRQRTKTIRAWSAPFLLAITLLGSSYIAVLTGEAAQSRAEAAMPAALIERHEEAADRFIRIVAIVSIIAGAGFARGSVGAVARRAATVGSFAVLFAGFQVGKAGGEVAYYNGAADAELASSAVD